MEIIKIKHPYNKEDIIEEEIVLVLGYFDGVHLAHQEVIKEGVRIGQERGLKVALMTFNRHPRIVYRKLKGNRYTNLTQPHQKARLIENLGVDILYEVYFNSEFGNLPPQEFVDQYIVGWHAKVIVAGYDYTYGKPEVASMEHLHDYAKGRFDIVQVGETKKSGQTISSTQIREYIGQGKIEEANAMLGYPYETLGFVIHGDARGRELGYPTANVYSHPYTHLPGIGIYAVLFTVKGKKYMGMASIGRNVTFKDQADISVEVNILDFNEEIYGDDVKIEWIAYLRGEEKFDDAEGLIQQLQLDEENTRKVLSQYGF
ncbi:MAG TPA: riboflavin biosynthesis protein RibF [Atopostipes sp.]|nr:riboflavin biosynthesis protein RibF [Atopostipes sp.]